MRIVLVINKPARELPIMEKVARWALKASPESKILTVDFHEPFFHAKILAFAPQVVLTFPLTAATLSEPFYLIKRLLGCFIVCFRTEGAIDFRSPQQLKWLAGMDRYGRDLVDYEVFWGERTARLVGDLLIEQGKLSSPERIRYYGYPNLEEHLTGGDHSGAALPAWLQTRLARARREKTLFFVTGFHLADYSREDLINAKDIVRLDDPAFEEELQIASVAVQRAKEFRGLWIEQILTVAREHPDMVLVVKRHPIETIIHRRAPDRDPYRPLTASDNIVFLEDDVAVGQILPHCALFLHYGSTCVAESYLLGVPSVFVTSRTLYGNGTPTPYDYADLGWPSTLTADIAELPELIRRHLREPVPFVMTAEMERVLRDVFNVNEEHLRGTSQYLPSRDLALFLLALADEKPQPIGPGDEWLSAALGALGTPTLGELGRRGMHAFEAGKTKEALPIFDTLCTLAKLLDRSVPDLEYLRAVCLVRCGRRDAAREVVHELLAQPPLHEKARELLGLINAPAPPVTAQAPVIFTIETTLACNLKCPECAIGGGMIGREKGMMNFEEYRVLADKIRPYARYVYLHIWGDPMLNPDIFEMIRYTAGFAGTNISTNGQCMTRETAQALIRSGVSDVIVSIDGASQEVYQKYRVGGDVEKAFGALAFLVEENRLAGGRVNIIPQFIVFQHNEHEKDAFARRCAELGLAATFKAPYIRTDDSPFAYCGDPAFQRPRFQTAAQLKEAMSGCPNTREVFTVLRDGSVVACCHDYAGDTHFGNLFDEEVPAIWESPAYRAFRAAVQGGNAPKFCEEKCMTWFMAPGTPAREAAPPVLVNLCCGPVIIPGFINVDAMPGGDLQLDLERELLPFPDNSVDAMVCISAVNYFSYQRSAEIIKDVHRVLKPGGIARFATHDLRVLARRYLEQDAGFYFQTVPDGRTLFPGATFCDKLNEFFYGFHSGDKHCRYVYDPESLAVHFKAAGFALIEEKGYRESAIPGSERFDNRPEQMFFLEAVKGGGAAQTPESRYQKILREKEEGMRRALSGPAPFRERGLALMEMNRERGWQLLLKGRELDPADREGTLACAAILEKEERYDDLVKLYTAYLKEVPHDAELVAAARRALERAEAKRGAVQAVMQRELPALASLERRLNRVLSDREHLDACAAWLRRAQRANPAGGVAALYYLDSKSWEVDYPETTGYIIPTLLAHYRLTGDRSWRDDAVAMGEWEMDIQSPEGGAGEPYGVYGLRPRVFNTGQVLLGFVSLYRETGSADYLEAAKRAGDWILSCLDSQGRWATGVYKGPRSYKSRVAWALLELYQVCGEKKYREGAERALSWILSQGRENGWFAENSLGDPERPWSHLTGYVLVGLLEVCRLGNATFDRERTMGMLRHAALGNAECYLKRRRATGAGLTIFPGTLDSSWQSNDNWGCITGTTQTEFFLRRMLPHLDSPRVLEAADGMLEDLKRLQMIDGISDPDLFGGLPGAYPFGAPYCTNAIPNWGVKFFADSLLQRLLPGERLDCIG